MKDLLKFKQLFITCVEVIFSKTWTKFSTTTLHFHIQTPRFIRNPIFHDFNTSRMILANNDFYQSRVAFIAV